MDGVEPPTHIRVPKRLGRKIEKLLRQGRCDRAWMMGGDEKHFHLSFEKKARVFSMGVVQALIDRKTLNLLVTNIHVAPSSPGKTALQNELLQAGADVTTDS